ncbi:MAG: hypothetical protein M3N43_09095 [Actinomycetota bacterium]|nr:hypothetical protein [Actinomycetota bacterium]
MTRNHLERAPDPPVGIVAALAGPLEATSVDEVREWVITITRRLLATDLVLLFEYIPGNCCLHCVGAGPGVAISGHIPEYARVARVANEGMPEFADGVPSGLDLELLACVPVRTDVAILGAIAVYQRRGVGQAPSAGSCHTLLAIGRQAGIALQRVAQRSRATPPQGVVGTV